MRRGMRLGLAGAAAVAVVLLLVSGLPTLFALAIYQAAFPSSISWDGKSAYAKCPSAIADARHWPSTPREACAAMHLCANEAQLSESQGRLLSEAIRKTPGCDAP